MGAARERDRSETSGSRDELIRRRFVCRGAVQGVGFRPAIYRLACALGLTGSVRNDSDGATVEVEGSLEHVESFEAHLSAALPPLARLDAVSVTSVPPVHSTRFCVDSSSVSARRGAMVPPDAALCDDCHAELDDPEDRRYRYPFTTCTNCGPRFTLVRSLPYDRARTSMAEFPLCAACAREYGDPHDRRFHAEPLCCPSCGPQLAFTSRYGEELGTQQAALEAARARLTDGAIVAVKGLGGYQLACRGDRIDVVRRLRRAKQRPAKPFALMVRNLAIARRVVLLRPPDERLLSSSRAPILLAPRLHSRHAVREVAPGLEDLGVLLPTTPLHVELFRNAPYEALVMTSGNASDEPICRSEAEARKRLSTLADYTLWHDREVVRRADDSVVRATVEGPILVRRSRGYVPEPLPLPEPASEVILALGGHLQNTACLASGQEAFLSQHVGDLDTELARAFLVEVSEGLEDFLQRRATIVVTDAHPYYPSTWLGERLAVSRDARHVPVQHHLAHAAAVLAEQDRFPTRDERVAAVVLDGTGYGPDGTAWGCELLMLDGSLDWWRVGHGSELPLVGGERAVRQPWRVACAVLQRAGHADLIERTPLAAQLPLAKLRMVTRLAGNDGWPRATGAGRVFEAAGALFGLAVQNTYEGEAAARFEALAMGFDDEPEIWPEVDQPSSVLPTDRLIVAAARRLAEGAEPAAELAAGFHATFCKLLAHYVQRRLPEGVEAVALGGGCLVNRLVANGLKHGLHELGYTPLVPREIPPGDGGLSYGQAVLAAVSQARSRHLCYRGEL